MSINTLPCKYEVHCSTRIPKLNPKPMVRVRPPLPRPANCPSLKFEHYSPEGNSHDAVVYFEKKNLLTFDGKQYKVTYKLPALNLIQDVFMMVNYKGFKTISVRFMPKPNYYVLSADCRRTVLHDLKSKDKAKLTSMLNTFGKDLVEEAMEVSERIKSMKRKMRAFQKDVKDAYPLFEFEEDLEIMYPVADSSEIHNMERDSLALMKSAKSLGSAAPFSKKRKASD